MNLGSGDTLIDINSIRRFRTTLDPIVQALDKLAWDMKLSELGYVIYGILDFSDLYRYLHPVLDRMAYIDEKRFASEQVALEYLFTKRPLKLFLPPVYVREYRATIEGSFTKYEDLASQTMTEIKKRVISWDQDWSRIASQLNLGTGRDVRATIARLDTENSVLLDVLFSNMRAEILKRGLEKFKRLVAEEVIVQRIDDPVFDDSDFHPPAGQGYNQLLAALERLRPMRPAPNRNDAEAINLLRHLNQVGFLAHRRYFVLVTSSPKIVDEFDREDAKVQILDDSLRQQMNFVSPIRDPLYFLVRFLMESPDQESHGFNRARFPNLARRYMAVATELERFVSSPDNYYQLARGEHADKIQTAKDLQSALQPIADAVEKFDVASLVGESFYRELIDGFELRSFLDEEKLNEQAFKSRLQSAVEDPGSFLKQLASASALLSNAIVDIEVATAGLVYRSSKSDFIYRFKVKNQADTDLQKKANEILDFLRLHELASVKQAIHSLAALRGDPRFLKRPELDVLSSKIKRSMSSYHEALIYAAEAEKKDPQFLESVFELCVCNRKIGQRPGNSRFLDKAWSYCCRALVMSPEDPRVLKEHALLIWLGALNDTVKWKLHLGADIDPLETIITECRKALSVSMCSQERDYILELALTNDLAFYLSLRKGPSDLEEALESMDEALVKKVPVLLEGGTKLPLGAFFDTRGAIRLAICDKHQSKDKDAYRQAAEDLIRGFREEEQNLVRLQHLAFLVDKLLDMKLLY